MGAVHGTRCRPLEIDSFAVVSAAVARTLEFVLTWFPVRSASEMRAARVDHKQPVGSAIHPNTVFLLEFRIDAEREFRRIADLEQGIRLEESARKKEAEEGEEPGSEKAC